LTDAALPERDCLAFVRERAFGQLSVDGGAEGPLASHVPVLLDADGGTAEMHLVRSTPLARGLETPRPALLAVTGADGYVSPDWYGLPDQVPTWNYVAVHLRGTLRALPEAELRGVLDRLSDAMEARLDKPPWTTAKMTPDTMARMMRALVACRLEIARVEGTFKLSQNKPAAARQGAAAALAAGGVPGQETATLAALMRAAGG